MKRNGFRPSIKGTEAESAPIIDLSSSSFEGNADDEIKNYQLLEQHVLKAYFIEENPVCEMGQNYLLIDNWGQQFNLSYHQKYEHLRFHFEAQVNEIKTASNY